MTNVIAMSRAESVHNYRKPVPAGARLRISFRETSLTLSLFAPQKVRAVARKKRGIYTV